jgi:hypothetical protein
VSRARAAVRSQSHRAANELVDGESVAPELLAVPVRQCGRLHKREPARHAADVLAEAFWSGLAQRTRSRHGHSGRHGLLLDGAPSTSQSAARKLCESATLTRSTMSSHCSQRQHEGSMTAGSALTSTIFTSGAEQHGEQTWER